jgi:hypothetical protein
MLKISTQQILKKKHTWSLNVILNPQGRQCSKSYSGDIKQSLPRQPDLDIQRDFNGSPGALNAVQSTYPFYLHSMQETHQDSPQVHPSVVEANPGSSIDSSPI